MVTAYDCVSGDEEVLAIFYPFDRLYPLPPSFCIFILLGETVKGPRTFRLPAVAALWYTAMIITWHFQKSKVFAFSTAQESNDWQQSTRKSKLQEQNENQNLSVVRSRTEMNKENHAF